MFVASESLRHSRTAAGAKRRESVGNDVQTVILFGSFARGEAKITSDVGLAVIATLGWDGRIDVKDSVRSRPGNDRDVLVFTAKDVTGLRGVREPVDQEILTDGIALIGSIPRLQSGVA